MTRSMATTIIVFFIGTVGLKAQNEPEQFFDSITERLMPHSPILDSLILNFDYNQSIQKTVQKFDTIYLIGDNSVWSNYSYLIKGKETVYVDSTWCNDKSITLGTNVRARSNGFNGLALSTEPGSNHMSWVIYSGNEKIEYVMGEFNQINGKNVPISAYFSLNGYSYRLENRLSREYQIICKSTSSDYLSFTLTFRKRFRSCSKQRDFFYLNGKTLSIVRKGNKIKHYQVFKGSNFGSTPKVVPNEPYMYPWMK